MPSLTQSQAGLILGMVLSTVIEYNVLPLVWDVLIQAASQTWSRIFLAACRMGVPFALDIEMHQSLEITMGRLTPVTSLVRQDSCIKDLIIKILVRMAVQPKLDVAMGLYERG